MNIFSELLAATASDTHRIGVSRNGIKPLVGALWKYRTLRPVVTHRLVQVSHGHSAPVGALARLLHRVVTARCAMDLPAETAIGPALAITHGWGLVVSPLANIGANVTLFHGVTLGARWHVMPDGQRVNGSPTVEDDVWIGPNATIVGPITIGKGSIIGPGANVIEDIPPGSLVVGEKATIRRSNIEPDVANPFDLTTLAR